MGEQVMCGLDVSGLIDFGGVCLIGVVDGLVFVDSYDVVIGCQLFGVSDWVFKIEYQGCFFKIDMDQLSEDVFVGFLGVVIGDLVCMQGEGGMVLGVYVRVFGVNFVVFGCGLGVFVDVFYGFVVGIGF